MEKSGEPKYSICLRTPAPMNFANVPQNLECWCQSAYPVGKHLMAAQPWKPPQQQYVNVIAFGKVITLV